MYYSWVRLKERHEHVGASYYGTEVNVVLLGRYFDVTTGEIDAPRMNIYLLKLSRRNNKID